MVKQALKIKQLEALVLEPKDLVGDDKNQKIKNIFKAAKSEDLKGNLSVVWLEEIDFIAGVKDKSQEALYTLLSELDSISENVLVIATTN